MSERSVVSGVIAVVLSSSLGCWSSDSGAADSGIDSRAPDRGDLDATAPDSGSTDARDLDATTPADAPPGGLIPISLPLPPQSAARLVNMGFDAVTAGDRAWVSTQTFDRDRDGNGPAFVYERGDSGAWTAATLPATTIAHYPSLCAAGSEVYVTLIDGDPCASTATARIFARTSGDAPTFVEQPVPNLGSAAGQGWYALHLACFAGGNLIAYGARCPAPGVTPVTPVIFRRDSTTAAWVALPVPAEAGPSNVAGVQSVLARADGSGYFVMNKLNGDLAVFERRTDGTWPQSFVVGNQIVQVGRLAGDPDGRAVASTIGGTMGYVQLDHGAWSFVAAPAFSALRTAAVSRAGLVLGGTIGQSNNFKMTVGHEPDFAPTPIGSAVGIIQALAFPLGSASGRAVVIAYNTSDLTGAYEWTP